MNRRTLLIVLMVFVAAAAAKLDHSRRSLNRILATAEQRRDELRRAVDRDGPENLLSEEATQSYALKQVLKMCRTVHDLPDLSGDRIVAHVQAAHGLELKLYVPPGKHSLRIVAHWQPAAEASPLDQWPEVPEHGQYAMSNGKWITQSERGLVAGEDPPVVDLRSWLIPLQSSSGYVLTLSANEAIPLAPPRWQLLGNHPEFVACEASLPLPGFEQQSWSRLAEQACLFPNQVSRSQLHERWKDPPHVNVLSAAMEGPYRDIRYQLKLLARIESEGPRCVDAEDALWILAGRDASLLGPHLAGGRFELLDPGREVGGRAESTVPSYE